MTKTVSKRAFIGIAAFSFSLLSFASAFAQPREVTLGDVFFARAVTFSLSHRQIANNSNSVIANFDLAAQHGRPDAYLELAKIFQQNNRHPQAVEYFTKAANLNVAGANINLAEAMRRANPNSCEGAVQYLDKALAEGYVGAKHKAADWYNGNICGANDDKKALELALEVSQGQYYKFITKIGLAYLNGKGTNVDLYKAWTYLTIASYIPKSDTYWLQHDPQIAIDALAPLDAKLKSEENGIALAMAELDKICFVRLHCHQKITDILPMRPPANRMMPAPPSPPPYIRNPALRPTGYIDFEDLSRTEPAKYSQLRELYSNALQFEREYFASRPNPINRDLMIEKYLPAAQAGHANAMYKLSSLYQEKRDYIRMKEWLKKAADAGKLAAMLEYGRLAAKDPIRCQDAIKYLEYAQYNRSVIANVELGRIYGSNICGPPNYEKAFQANTVGARYGHFASQLALAEYYRDGKGTAQDFVKGASWGKIAWYNSPDRGMFAPTALRLAFSKAKEIEARLSIAEQNQVKNNINAICENVNSCRNISNEDMLKLQHSE